MEKEIVYKKWFSGKPFVEKFCNFKERGEQSAFAERLGISCTRLLDIMDPEYLMTAYMADKYAIKLRISSS